MLHQIIQRIQGPGFPGHFFALAAGAMLPFSFAPYQIWPLQFISLALFFLSLQQITPKQALWRGWWFGLGLFAAGVSWVYVSIHFYSHTPVILASLMTFGFVAGLAWFIALQTWAFQKWFKTKPASWLSFAAVWALGEWWRSWFLTGFPWLFLGDPHVDSWLAGFAPVFGVYGISFLIALLAASLVRFIPAINEAFKTHTLSPSIKLGMGLWIAPWLMGVLLLQIDWTHTDGDAIDVVAIQGNIPQERKWLAEEIYPTLEKYREASEKNWDAQLILWPETAITVLHHQAREYIKFLDESGKEHHTALLSGIPYQQQQTEDYPGAFHNTIMALGEGSGLYHKRKLVPFGEYMPFPDSWRPLLSFFNIPMSQFMQGQVAQPGLKIESATHSYGIAPFICYDVVYPDYVAQQSRDSGLMVTISNDAWFGASIGPKQHLGIARMRALENGRYLLRSTNTGITALMDDKGDIVAQLPQFEYGVLRAKAEIKTGNTPFNIWGSHLILVLLATVLLAVIWLSRKPSLAIAQSESASADTDGSHTENGSSS